MAGSRDVLNAFIAHIDGLVEADHIDRARTAWSDFIENVVPSFPDRHRDEALRRRAEFDDRHATKRQPGIDRG